ncbi:hypothetical protein HNQ51_001760 [Inhella inkyongensis]|uniref:Uncharacterized protein n=1 Tax=Inhella inkyongensis TaxID=392593 RepID=A0A840S612_9BURK|nr:hypothetical protein [Inhella inkyongensis]MBB5204446.1 hypothetical protein [Inhella inkyongensis]
MAIDASKFTIDGSGNIRQVSAFVPGTDTRYPTLDLHAWLQDLADNPSASGDDLVSILGSNPSELAGKRNAARPMALTLLPTMNLNDATAQWFNFGSVEQDAGQTLYTGLKVLGTNPANTPIYITQNNAKITKSWADSEIANFQILVKAKSGGALIAGGDLPAGSVAVYSRKYGQTFSHFDVSLSAGGEQVAAISTAADGNVSLSAAAAEAVWNTMTVAAGDTNQDLGNGNGSKLYKGTITLNGTTTLAQAYQALMWACSESSTATVVGVPGWRYRKLNTNYAENAAAPFGNFAGGKFFLAQGWFIAGVMSADSKNYQLIAHDGTTQSPPTSVQVQIAGLVAGDYVIAARDNGSGGFLNDTTLASTASVGATSVTLTAAPGDTPTGAGYIRINGKPHTYTGRAGNVISGLSPAVPAGGYASGLPVFIPFVDAVASGATISSGAFQFSAPFTVRYKVRNGGGSPIVPFESTLSVTEAGGSGNTVRTADA